MIRDTSGQDAVLSNSHSGRHKKTIAIVVLIAIALIGCVTLLSSWGRSSQSVSLSRLTLATVTRGTLIRDASVNGRMVAANSPTLYASAAGTVTLKVNAGDKVKKGDIVAELDSPELSNELKREQANFEQLDAEVAHQRLLAKKQKLAARRDADQAEIERVSAQRAYERVEKAGYEGVVQKNEFMRIQDALKTAEIKAKHAEAASNLETEDVDLVLKTKMSQLEQQKLVRDNVQRRVNELKLLAPVDGVVGTLSVSNRTVVAANTALMTLVDLSQLEVELEIPETYVADLGLGMNIELTINGVKAKGKLSAMSPEVVKNEVLARARFVGEVPAGLRQSQRVSARLLIEEKPNVLMVQRGPFLENDGGHFAYLVSNSLARRTAITVGATSVSAVEISSGLKEGDQIVISGSDLFGAAKSVSLN
ncbi:efflux RND transporter periplasmic adaptor subunit [Undibacterium sp. Ji67W]|uniref:efflux RND transporter periplasmic adaptor subunit n=1 Tax=Undibacterium sp. Ji67W TaxID=3413042 RepID=UPI003BF203F2